MINVASKKIHIEEANKEVMKKIITKDAAERLSRVKISSPVIASQLEAYLLQVYQTGQLTEKVNDVKLKQILQILTPKKKQIKIKRKRR